MTFLYNTAGFYGPVLATGPGISQFQNQNFKALEDCESLFFHKTVLFLESYGLLRKF